jgi:hypothetical protein
MPCLALVEPSEPCEIETEGVDDDELPEEELDGAGAGAGAGAEGCETAAEEVADEVGVADATTGVADTAGAA